MRDGETLLCTALPWDCLKTNTESIGFMISVKRQYLTVWANGVGYNHIPYLNCPASDKCRGCDAGKFFGKIFS